MMNHEKELYNKINTLQTEMLEFSKRISPAKNEEERRVKDDSCVQPDESKSKLCQSTLSIFKILICTTGSLLFPTAVYYIEGKTILFWQATAISCLIIFLLIFMLFSAIHCQVDRLKIYMKALLNTKSSITKEQIFSIIVKVKQIEFCNNLTSNIVYIILLLGIIMFSSITAYKIDLLFIFYASLIIIGFIIGILTTKVQNSCTNELPLHSSGIKLQVTKASPTAKRELKFSDMFYPKRPQSYINSISPTSQNTESCMEKLSPNLKPNTPPPSYFEAIRNIENLDLSPNFNFLKNLE
ncbi:uncharacterized protein LOC118192657 [Stegodyphus dumicola]|uniref:uncharacterized protein LOC118192657 n=1 Tax=Stegodyphus dumicola TaxID=202533 RepID=UPI0015A80005|nr:uncharacterized protein LOC118192657 [Stegodyphus dumicola]